MYKCEICGKHATRSIQTLWHDYDITKDDNFVETNQWESDENHFFCDKHAEEFLA